MTGLVEPLDEDCKDLFESGHSRDPTVDTSHSSVGGDIPRVPVPPPYAATPPRPVSSRRRRGQPGSKKQDDALEKRYEYEQPIKPASRRRRSLCSRSSVEEESEDIQSVDTSEAKWQAQRSANERAPEPPPPIGTPDSIDRKSLIEMDAMERKTPSNTRRSFFGSSSNLSQHSEKSHSRPSSPSVGKLLLSSMDIMSLARGVNRSKSSDGMEKPEPRRGSGLGGSWSFHSAEGSRRSNVKSGEISPTDSITADSVKKPSSLRRFFGSSNNSLSDAPEKPKSCRASVGGGSQHTRGSNHTRGSESAADKPSAKQKRNLAEGSLHSTDSDLTPGKPLSMRSTAIKSPAPIVKPHELVNKSRVKRGLTEFSRNMLMDTIAKQVAQDLAASLGTKCSPTSYYGNVGQGESVQNIHKTMMSQKGGTARSNLLAPHFTEIGIGIARGNDGLIYMCQLFN